MEVNIQEIKDKLKKYNQEHLMLKYDEFSDEEKKILLKEIENIDFEKMQELYEKAAKSEEADKKIEIEPVNYVDKEKLSYQQKEDLILKGKSIIKQGKLATVTMAGGQGTRLGHDAPKGTFDFGVGASLFEIYCENLKETFKNIGTYIHWYIMTSPENNDETVNFFEENNYFGYPKNYIHFFIQEEMPMISEDGKILLNEDGFVKFAANGHGGTLYSLEKSGITEEMNKEGIEYIFISGVDNCLADPADPLFVGFIKDKEADIVVKSIEKIDPKEKVGVFCKKNGKVGVVEYSEISERMANLKDDYGSLVYGDSNSLLQIFSIDILNKLSKSPIPYHVAYKKADYLNENKEIVKADKPNAYKFELFIFDAFEQTDNIQILRVQREDEFAPIKNKEGQDSPKTAKKLYIEHKNKKEAYKRYQDWKNNSLIDEETKEELNNIKENDSEIRDRFYKELEFGTAGLRGVLGAGTNRMNKYNVAKATQGVANYILSQKLDKKPVVIAYDVRNSSREFAEVTARCFAANGITTYVYNDIQPVPMLSYSTRKLGAVCGIMITASHNPPEYNGYKLFWSKGSQIVGDTADLIIKEVNNIKDFSTIKTMTLKKAKEKKLFIELGDSLPESFMKNVESFAINNEEIKEEKKNIKIVYSPIHGTGIKQIPTLFKKLGYENVYIVPEQEMPNPYFPTVEKPNPEEKEANNYAIKLAKEVDADYTITTDPDADRIGISVKIAEGKYRLLTGNEMGILFVDYVLNQLEEKNKLPENGAVISTIVSTRLTEKMAKDKNIKYIDTLTGFKYAGELINKFEKEKTNKFIFAFEESFGYLFGTNARDKDAVSTTMLAAEMFTYYKKINKNLIEKLEEIYKKYGYHISSNDQLVLTGEEGQEKINQIMNNLRENPMKNIGNIKTKKIRDLKASKAYNFETENEEDETLPKSNVILYELEDGSWFGVRPSGTEPKLKFYLEAIGNTKEEAESKRDLIKNEINKIKNIAEDTERKKIIFTKKGNNKI